MVTEQALQALAKLLADLARLGLIVDSATDSEVKHGDTIDSEGR